MKLPAVFARCSTRRVGLALVLLGAIAGASVVRAQSFGDYLLPDGSFESTDASEAWPKHWPRANNVTWESEDGNRFLRITAPKPNIISSIFAEAPIPMGVSAIELSFRRRVSGLVIGEKPWFDARVIVNFRDASGKKTPAKRLPYIQRNTNGWEPVVHRMAVPSGTVSIEVMPALFRVEAGVFDIDDLVVKSIDPSLAP